MQEKEQVYMPISTSKTYVVHKEKPFSHFTQFEKNIVRTTEIDHREN